MKKCILMFALLVIALLVAVLSEKDSKIIPDQELLLSDIYIENTLLNNDYLGNSNNEFDNQR